MKTLSLTICLLLIGCNMGLTHGANEKVVFLDGSEILVPIDPVRLGSEFNYKVVTTNQDVADATAIPFTWHGGTVRPLAPINLHVTRNAAGDILFEWTYRSRMGAGLRPYSDVPIAEETLLFELEFFSGATILRTVRAFAGPIPVLWANTGNFTPITAAADGTLVQSAIDVQSQLQSQQRITGDFTLETTLDHSISGSSGGLAQTDGIVTIVPAQGFWDTDPSHAPGYTHGDTFVTFENTPGMEASNLVTGDHLVIELRGRTFYYYVNPGPNSPPLFTSTRNNIPFPLIIQAELQGFTATSPVVLDNITRPTLNRFLSPSYLYTAAQQTADFGSPQSSIKWRIRQISALVGRGAYNEATQ